MVRRECRWPLAVPGIVVGLLLSGCAGGPDATERTRPAVAAGEFGTPDCVLRHIVADFDVLDDRNLILFAAGGAEAYHVQVSPPATELRFTDALALESRSTRICGYAGDALLVDVAGQGPRRLAVIGVFRLDEAALAGLRARFGHGPPRPPAVVQPGAGAVIERDLGGDP
ncbi:MAG: hypothetical protein IT486_13220 [Gammaproteobacteria bacterium]|nr:hypothetical protein [Gammaproteobacteria bacterium]